MKYDTPEFAGFTATVAWGEDDYWDVGLRYEGEFNGIKIGAGIAYGENTDVQQTAAAGANFRDTFVECMTQTAGNVNDLSPADCDQIGGSVSLMHVESGLYANFAAGQLQDNLIKQDASFVGTGADDTSTFWAVEAGIEKKWFDLGKTTLFAQYYDHDGGANDRRTVGAADAVNPFAGTTSRIYGTGIEMVGVGVVQEISKASMLLYTYYRHYEADLTVMSTTTGVDPIADAQLEDLDVIMSGAMIKF